MCAARRAARHLSADLASAVRLRISYFISRGFRGDPGSPRARRRCGTRDASPRATRRSAFDRTRDSASLGVRRGIRMLGVREFFFPSPAGSIDITLFFLSLPIDDTKKALVG
jgi:hypothetical protein